MNKRTFLKVQLSELMLQRYISTVTKKKQQKKTYLKCVFSFQLYLRSLHLTVRNKKYIDVYTSS